MPIYLNNAATSWPKALGVGDAVGVGIDSLPYHAGRSGFNGGKDVPGRCRSLLADLLAVRHSERIVFCSNATHALNIALHGMAWRQGAVVVTSAAEHNSVLRPLHFLAQHQKITVHVVEVDKQGRIIPEAWEDAIKEYHPQLVVFTHASNVTGAVNNAALLGKIAREEGAVSLLDASQSLGILPVLPEIWKIDMVAFTGHKYILGPPGTGGLYIEPSIALNPVWVGGTGVQSDLEDMPVQLPIRFEAGTSNDPAIMGLATAIEWSRENPLDYADLISKLDRLTSGLFAAGAKLIDVAVPRTPVVSFTLPGWDVEDVGEVLYKSFDIVCRTGLHCAPRIHACLGTGPQGTIRLSLSRFTTPAEIDYCIQAVGEMQHAVL